MTENLHNLTKNNFMSAQKKKNTLVAIFASLFFLGMIIGGWGWDKHESTIAKRTKGSVAMMWIGGVMIGAGLLGMWRLGGKTKRAV